MYQIVRQRGSYGVRLDNSPIFAKYKDAEAWMQEFLNKNENVSCLGQEELSVGAIVAEDRAASHRF